MLDEKLKQIFERAGADALYLEQDFLRRYITGFYSTDGFVVIANGECIFFADARYIEAAQKALKDTNIKVVEGAYKEAIAALKPYKNIGVPFAYTTLARAEALKKEGFALVDCADALKEAMLIKTPAEISLISRACEIAEDALLKVLAQIKEGMKERELAAVLEFEMRALGAEGTSFETIVAFGANGSVPHHETGESVLKFGDAVLIDFGCKVQGYCSDCTRTFLFGDDKKHEEFKSVYAHVLKAHELIKEELTEGMTGREADAIARTYLQKQGLGQYFTHSLGHGIGLQIHEYPVLSPRSEEKLVNGMVFSDEPGVYIAGKIGVRIEDSVYMTGGKVRSFMNKTQRNLIIL